MEAKACRNCGFRTINIEDDVCAWCGHRDRWIQSPLPWLIVMPVVTIIAGLIIWRKL